MIDILTKEKFKEYVYKKTEIKISTNIVDKIINCINEDTYKIFLMYFEHGYSFECISKITNKNNFANIYRILDRLVYLAKLFESNKHIESDHDINLDSEITILNLSNLQIQVLNNEDIYTIEDLVNYINNGNHLYKIKGITKYVEQRIIKMISIFLPVQYVLQIKYGKKCVTNILSILSNSAILN